MDEASNATMVSNARGKTAVRSSSPRMRFWTIPGLDGPVNVDIDANRMVVLPFMSRKMPTLPIFRMARAGSANGAILKTA